MLDKAIRGLRRRKHEYDDDQGGEVVIDAVAGTYGHAGCLDSACAGSAGVLGPLVPLLVGPTSALGTSGSSNLHQRSASDMRTINTSDWH